MELPKRARTADWENGVLTLDGEKKFDIPELTTEIMEQLAGYTLVGFHVKSYPVTDELLATCKPRTMLTQFVLDFSLRQNKSGGRFLALRSVDVLNLFCFGRDGGIQKT